MCPFVKKKEKEKLLLAVNFKTSLQSANLFGQAK